MAYFKICHSRSVCIRSNCSLIFEKGQLKRKHFDSFKNCTWLGFAVELGAPGGGGGGLLPEKLDEGVRPASQINPLPYL